MFEVRAGIQVRVRGLGGEEDGTFLSSLVDCIRCQAGVGRDRGFKAVSMSVPHRRGGLGCVGVCWVAAGQLDLAPFFS